MYTNRHIINIRLTDCSYLQA